MRYFIVVFTPLAFWFGFFFTLLGVAHLAGIDWGSAEKGFVLIVTGLLTLPAAVFLLVSAIDAGDL